MHKKVHSTFSTVLYNKTIVTVKILNSYSHIKIGSRRYKMPHGMQKKERMKKENDKKYDIRKTGKTNPFICASADCG